MTETARNVRNAAAPLVALVLCAACPETTTSQQCPVDTTSAGTFQLTFTLQETLPRNCRVTSLPDGGAADASLGAALAATTATVCSGIDAADGGGLFYLAVGRSLAAGTLSDGGFATATPARTFDATRCICPVTVVETMTGTLRTSGDAGVVVDADGGLPPLTGFSAVLKDEISASADAGCHCNLPCAIEWTMEGTRQ